MTCFVGLGRLRILEDHLLLRIVGCLPASALLALSAVCKALYCVANHEEVWRALVLEVASQPRNKYRHYFATASQSLAKEIQCHLAF